MSCLVIALAMVIVVVAVASSSGYEVIDTGGMAIPEHYRALTRRPLCSALVEKHLTLRKKTVKQCSRRYQYWHQTINCNQDTKDALNSYWIHKCHRIKIFPRIPTNLVN